MAEGKPIPVRFSVEFIARLDQVAADVGVTRSALIRMLVEKWVDHFEQHGTASLPPNWKQAMHSRDAGTDAKISEAIQGMGFSVSPPPPLFSRNVKTVRNQKP